MSLKSWITAALLIFVAFAVIYAFVKTPCPCTGPAAVDPCTTVVSAAPAPAAVAAIPDPCITVPVAAPTPAADHVQVMVYYLLIGAKRCPTCMQIESQTAAAVQDGFGDQLADGSVAFRRIDVDDPDHDELAQTFQAPFKTVVVCRYRNGALEQWKRLDEVWSLVRKDPSEFSTFIINNVRVMLDAPAPSGEGS